MIKIIRKLLAKYYKVPFCKKVWYNYRAMLGRDHEYKTFVECFDNEGNYIYPIDVGMDVIYYVKGKRYVYTIVGFDNDRQDKDWLNDTDYINPIIEFKKKL